LNTTLPEIRQQLDELDQQLVKLLGRRFELCQRAALAKQRAALPMMQPARIEEVKARAAALAGAEGVDPAFARELFARIIDEACRLERRLLGKHDTSERGLRQQALRIDHVAIAVRDLEAAIESYRERFGFELVERRSVEGKRSGMESAVMAAGGVTIVLVQGTSPESNVSQYIASYGPGVQHLAIEVDDLDATRADLVERRCDLLTKIIRGDGLFQMFTRREPNSGMQIELLARSTESGFKADNVQALFEAMERDGVY